MKEWHGNASKRKTNCIGSPITVHMTLDCVHCMLDACPVVCLLLSPGQVITRQECICLIFVDHILINLQQRAKWNKYIHDSILCGLVCDLPNMYKISCVRNKKRSSKWQIDNHRRNTYIIWMAGSRFVFASEVICWDAFPLALPATFCSAAGRHAPCSSLLEATEPWDPRGPDLVLFCVETCWT